VIYTFYFILLNRYIFVRFDVDRDNRISKAEFKRALGSSQNENRELERQYVRPLIEELQRLLRINHFASIDEAFAHYVIAGKLTRSSFEKGLSQLHFDLKMY
jgi:hypothetical protein